MPYKISKEDNPGIYKITNKINGKVYIGQSWHLDARWIQHKSREHNPHLARAFKQYGIENFEYSIIERFAPEENTRDLLNEREVFYIKQYNALDRSFGYNIRPGGNESKMAPETIEKLKAIRGPLHHGWHRIVSDEERRQMSERIRGEKNPMYGRSPSKEINERYSRERRGAMNPAARAVRCIDTGEVFETIKAAADSKGIGRDPIAYVCHNKRKHAGGLRWEFVDGK